MMQPFKRGNKKLSERLNQAVVPVRCTLFSKIEPLLQAKPIGPPLPYAPTTQSAATQSQDREGLSPCCAKHTLSPQSDPPCPLERALLCIKL
jgi:hypothetical protein